MVALGMKVERVTPTISALGKHGDGSFFRSYLKIKNTGIGRYKNYNHNKIMY